MTPPTRLAAAIQQSQDGRRTAIIPYFPVGFPEADSAVALIEAAGDADAIELGVPFSDPLADGPTIQRATTAALANGTTLDTCLAAVRTARSRGVTTPLIFMGYYNPLFHRGVDRFAEEAANAGLDGCIVPDLPPEEAGPLNLALAARGMSLIPMVAPTSTSERIRRAVAAASGFVYCVSVTGVTGSRGSLPADLPVFLDRVRAETTLPIAVGFGITTRQHVEEVGRLADIAIVGSAVVDRISGRTTASAATALGDFVRELAGR